MTRWTRAVPALLALAAAACSDDTSRFTQAVNTLPFSPTTITQGVTCSGARTVEPPAPGGTLELGTITTITRAGTYRLPTAPTVKLTLTGAGDYLVSTSVSDAPGATTTFSARGIADGNVRLWTLTPPGELQLNPAAGSSFTLALCAS